MTGEITSVQEHLNTIAAIFYRLGGRYAVICPGSRNAPVISAFAHHKGIECISIADERSAGFTGLGIAQQTKKPVAIICTSGTAVLNFYPAICEAFYQGIPLIAITADRPAELIDQWDGQAIRQKEIFRNHILDEVNIDTNGSFFETEFRISFSISISIQQSLPVHINIPLREPFYPSPQQKYHYETKEIPIQHGELLPFHRSALDTTETGKLIQLISRSSKTIVLIGANNYTGALMKEIHEAKKKSGFVLITDILSNYEEDDMVNGYDLILGGNDASHIAG